MSKTVKKGAPECGLYVVLPSGIVLSDLVMKLRQLFTVTTHSEYEKNMHAVELAYKESEPDFVEKAKAVATLAQAAGWACLLRNDYVLASELGFDGVMLERVADIPKARELLGERIVGMHCYLSQERAEEALARGADCLSFSYPGFVRLPPEEIVAWCATLTEKPAIVEGPMTNDECRDYVLAGAGFMGAGDYIFNHPQGVMQGAVNMLYAIDLALDLRTRN